MHSSLMMNLLRILTPEEINELTTTSEGNKRVPLTHLMFHKMGLETSEVIETSSLAKILPFTYAEKEQDDESVDQDEQIEVGTSEELVQEIVCLEQETSLATEEVSGQGRLPTSVFILHEKKRLEASVHKMRSKELLKNYKKNASLDIEQERNLRDDMKK